MFGLVQLDFSLSCFISDDNLCHFYSIYFVQKLCSLIYGNCVEVFTRVHVIL